MKFNIVYQCQKCKRFSGDDWAQCGRGCPVVASPWFQPEVEVVYGPLVEMTEGQLSAKQRELDTIYYQHDEIPF